MTTVRELITRLEEMPQNAVVLLGDMHIEDKEALQVEFDRVDGKVWVS